MVWFVVPLLLVGAERVFGAAAWEQLLSGEDEVVCGSSKLVHIRPADTDLELQDDEQFYMLPASGRSANGQTTFNGWLACFGSSHGGSGVGLTSGRNKRRIHSPLQTEMTFWLHSSGTAEPPLLSPHADSTVLSTSTTVYCSPHMYSYESTIYIKILCACTSLEISYGPCARSRCMTLI